MNFGAAKFRELLFVATCGMGAEFMLALADTVVAGHVVGETALAGINLLQPVFNIVQFVAALVGTGAAIRFSFETGRLDSRRASEMFSQGMWSVLAFGTALLVAFVFAREAFIGFFGASEEVAACARAYWVWYAPCALLLPVTLYLIALVYADGGMRSCAMGYASLIGGNIVASYFLCRQMGIAGCALGTVLGNSAAILSLSGHFLRKSNSLRLVRHFSLRDLLLICKSSFADASVTLCWAGLFLMLDKLVIVEFGSDKLPVLSVVLACVNLTLLFNGISAAAQPLVGVYAGERNSLGVKSVMNAAMKTSFAEGALAAAFFAAVPQAAVALVGIKDPSLVPVAHSAVRIVSIGFIAAPFVFLFNSYYLFVERYALACSLTFVADIVAYAILCPPMAHFGGMTGLWIALGAAPVAAVAAFGLFVFMRHGARRFPLLLPPERAEKQFAFGFMVEAKGIEAAARFASSTLAGAGRGDLADEAGRIVGAVFAAVAASNGSRRVRGEAGIDLNEGANLVLRDDGIVYDPTPAAAPARGKHFVTMGYNRSIFGL